jgi:hypothetical protein
MIAGGVGMVGVETIADVMVGMGGAGRRTRTDSSHCRLFRVFAGEERVVYVKCVWW